MGEIVKIKHLIWTLGTMLIFSFGLGVNVNTKLNQVETNTQEIEHLKDEGDLREMLIIQNHQEVMQGFTETRRAFADLKLELKLELKDKKNRD
jgi:hypothetical protein